MRITFIATIYMLFIGYTNSALAQCQDNNNEISARYQVNHSGKSWKNSSQYITLYRYHNDVAYQYEQKNITEYWHKQPNGLIALTRYFDKEKKGIEYQANELKNSQSWQQINELISPVLRSKMQLISTRDNACQTEQKWQLQQNKTDIELTWLPQLKLVKTLAITSGDKTTLWQLQTLNTSGNKIAEKFSLWQQYKTTDYADVGDNEDDPFLAKMINLGFIEHGASGFYQSNGASIHVDHY